MLTVSSGADGVGYVWEAEGEVVESVKAGVHVGEGLRWSILWWQKATPNAVLF